MHSLIYPASLITAPFKKDLLYILKIAIHIVLYILKYYTDTLYWLPSEKPQRMRRAFLSGVLTTFQHFQT